LTTTYYDICNYAAVVIPSTYLALGKIGDILGYQRSLHMDKKELNNELENLRYSEKHY